MLFLSLAEIAARVKKREKSPFCPPNLSPIFLKNIYFWLQNQTLYTLISSKPGNLLLRIIFQQMPLGACRVWPWFNKTKNKDGGQRSRRQLAKQKTNIARKILGRHGENMHHGQGATGGGGGILTTDLMNQRSKMKVDTCLGRPGPSDGCPRDKQKRINQLTTNFYNIVLHVDYILRSLKLRHV